MLTLVLSLAKRLLFDFLGLASVGRVRLLLSGRLGRPENIVDKQSVELPDNVPGLMKFLSHQFDHEVAAGDDPSPLCRHLTGSLVKDFNFLRISKNQPKILVRNWLTFGFDQTRKGLSFSPVEIPKSSCIFARFMLCSSEVVCYSSGNPYQRVNFSFESIKNWSLCVIQKNKE